MIIDACRYRAQEWKAQETRERLILLIQRATTPPKKRYSTRPSRAAHERRLDPRRQRGMLKRLRRPPSGEIE